MCTTHFCHYRLHPDIRCCCIPTSHSPTCLHSHLIPQMSMSSLWDLLVLTQHPLLHARGKNLCQEKKKPLPRRPWGQDSVEHISPQTPFLALLNFTQKQGSRTDDGTTERMLEEDSQAVLAYVNSESELLISSVKHLFGNFSMGSGGYPCEWTARLPNDVQLRRRRLQLILEQKTLLQKKLFAFRKISLGRM